jgi:hypothetical protein
MEFRHDKQVDSGDGVHLIPQPTLAVGVNWRTAS